MKQRCGRDRCRRVRYGFVESTDQSARRALAVPADQFDATLNRLLDLGKKRSLEVHGQDVTGAVADLEARLRNLRAQEAVLLELMRKATTIGDSIAVQQQLSQNQEQIEQLDAQHRVLADQTTATLTVARPGGAARSHPESSTTIGTAWDDASTPHWRSREDWSSSRPLPIVLMAGAGFGWRAVARPAGPLRYLREGPVRS